MTSATKTATAASCSTARLALWRSRTEIPNPSMHPGGRRQGLRSPRPVRRIVKSVRIYGRESIFARVAANHFSRGIENFKCHWSTRVCFQVEIDRRTSRWIIRDGLVARVPDAEDRRSVRARLTDAGRARIESIWKEGLEHQFEMVEGMSKDDLAQLRHLCLLLVENARKELRK